MGGIYEVVVSMGSGAVMYIPGFIKIGSGAQKLMGWGEIHRRRQYGDLLSLLLFYFILSK
jgi:hypothetical protein